MTGLGSAGIDYLFANAGTDFPPIIEALASLDPGSMPIPVTVPHETAAVAMAHGAWLVSGRAQAVMVHVNVGLANSVMGVINAASDNIPMLVMSGRTPITERGRTGARMTPIQYGQEMFDQTSMVRDVVKYSYEMRYPEQGDQLVHRAMSIALSEPTGPVYLSLPKEPLSEAIPEAARISRSPAPASTLAQPDANAIATAAAWLAEARAPVLLVQRGDVAGKLSKAISDLAQAHGIAVHEPFSIRNVMASDDPVLQGYGPAGTKGADLVIVVDSGTPWIEATQAPEDTARVIHIGPDPQFARMPVRGYQTDLAIASDAVAAVQALQAASQPGPKAASCLARLAEASAQRRASMRTTAESGARSPMSSEWISACVSDVMDDRAIVFSELGLQAGCMDLKGPNRHFNNVHAGGLGWGFPAALGAQLMDRERLVVAAMGDGSYMFSNPVACHQIAEALNLPILILVKNNGIWNAVRRSVVNGYPDGAAARMNEMPLTSLQPLPDFAAIARASRAHAERIEEGADLPDALRRAVNIIRQERRAVLLELRTEVSDSH